MGDVILDYIPADISYAAEKFAWAPKVLVLAQKAELPPEHAGGNAFEKLQCPGNRNCLRAFDKKVDVVRHHLHFINFVAVIDGYLAQSAFADFAVIKALEQVKSIFGFPNQMIGILADCMA